MLMDAGRIKSLSSVVYPLDSSPSFRKYRPTHVYALCRVVHTTKTQVWKLRGKRGFRGAREGDERESQILKTMKILNMPA